jgi:hypothetical protein
MKLQKLKLLTVQLGFVSLLSALAALPAFSQTASPKVAPKPFEPGEELVYKAELSRSLLRKMDVATFKFTANKTPVDRKTNAADDAVAVTSVDPAPYAFKFTGDVSSEGFFVKLFNIHFHQHVESIVDPESLAVQKTIKFDEQGKRVRSSETIFDRTVCKIIWTERDPNNPTRPLRTASTDLSGPVQDVVSGIYYVRTQQLEVGKSFEVPISDSGRIYHVPVHVVEKKRMKTVLGRVPVVLVEVQLFGERGMVSTKGQFSIWLTDDQRHIPVSAALKTEYGTFDITLKKVSHQASQPALATK